MATYIILSTFTDQGIKNVKVAGCVLAAVRSWQFPKPPSGVAKGVYSITYQQ